MAATRKRAPARKTRKPTARRGPRRRTGRARTLLRMPALDQRQRDLLGLALIAVGVFLGFVLYGNWNGGSVGQRLTDASAWLVGAVRYAVPVALVVGGAALLLRPVLPALRPLRTGIVCLFAAVTLALAAGTFGLGPAGRRTAFWQPELFKRRGGIMGEAEYWAVHHLVWNVGAGILAVFLFLVGVLLVTGASLSSIIRATGAGLADTTRVLRQRGPAKRPARQPHPLRPPEPDDRELIVRSTHVEAPPPPPDLGDQGPPAQPWAQDPLEPREPAAEAPDAAPAQPDDEEVPAGVARASAVVAGDEALTPQGRLRDVVTDDPDFLWEVPASTRVLERSSVEHTRPDTAGQERVAARLLEALGHFGVQAQIVGTVAGPHITRYELRLAPGTKVAKVAQLKDDLAYALAATDIRILAPIPGKQAVGVEVPNAQRRVVRLGDVFQDPPPDWSPLTVWLGKDVAGKAIGADLAKMPHLLVAGTTGSGKSGAINAMLSSVLLRATPHEVRLVLVDPKQVELNHYESIPHLLTPVITSPRMAANALQNLVREMESRYGIMSLARTRSLVELNRVRERRGEAPLPYILCVIDELADLMMVAPADVEDSIIRLAQKARAVGIHLVLATQSPRVDVITGMIKANVPSRIAFAVSSQTDSRVILDHNGAESLLGQGDMLFSPVGSSRLQRIQGAYIDESQIAKLTDFWRRQGEPEFHEELLEEVEPADGEDGGPDDFDPDEDPLLQDAIALVAEMQTASTSMLQRRLRLGYTRAGRLIDMLERRGVISGYEGSKPRQVLITEADVPRVLAALAERGATGARGGEPAVQRAGAEEPGDD
jgi:DNA segregation ATPase FtsK/SpoIIIE, S-DNA-T family